MRKTGLKWYHGLIILACFAAVIVLQYFGLIGKGILSMILGELLFVLIAILVALLTGERLSSVFPIKRMRWLQLAGIYLMWRGVLATELFLSEVLIYFFPKHFQDTSGMEQWMAHTPFALAMLLIAIIPAICEEMLFRGTLLKSMRSLKWPWLIVILNGLIFGIAHLSPIKLASVTLFGILLAYIAYRSENLAYPILLHMVNNGWVVVTTYAMFRINGTSQAAKAAGSAQVSPGLLGATLCAAALAPILIYIGNNLFIRPENNRRLPPGEKVTFNKNWLWLTGSVSVLIFALGTLLFALGFEDLVKIGLDSLK